MNVLVIYVGLEAKSYAVNADEFRAQNAERGMSSTAGSALIARREQQIADMENYVAEESLLYGPVIAN